MTDKSETATVDTPVLAELNAPEAEPLRLAYFWLLAFVVITFARPEDWIPGVGRVPLAKIAGILAFVAVIAAVATSRARVRYPRETIYLFVLFGQLCLTVPFSPVWRSGAFQGVLEFSKVVIVGILMLLCVRTLTRLRQIILVQVACVAIVAIVSVWKARHLGARLEGVIGGMYANSNDLALTIVVSLPICLVLLYRSRSLLRRAAWIVAIMVMMYAVFLTSSRAGLFSLIVVTAVCLWEFGIRGRRRYLFLVVIIVAAGFSIYASNGVMNRFSSADRSAAASSDQRRELLIRSLQVTAHHPLFGVGPGNFVIVSGSWLVSHNAYTQMSSEGGLPALLLYLLILWRGFANIRSIQRLSPRRGLRLLAGALRASLAGFLVGSFFASVAYQFITYFLVFYTTALYRIVVRDRLRSRSVRSDVPIPSAEPAVHELA